MAGISISGLVSGSFDWKSVVDQLITIDSAPVTRLTSEESANIDRLASFATLKSKLSELQTTSKALNSATLFSGRSASSSTTGSDWALTAATDATTGSYDINVTRLATASRRNGASAVSSGISATDTVTGVTLATMPTATAVTAGTFTVSGKQVTIALTDTLQDVFTKISTATGGKVTGSYSAAADKITLSSTDASEVVLGAGNDTSNFLSAVRLANNGGTSTTSATTLGTASLAVPLASSRLKGVGAIAATGTFQINGVDVGYDTATDSLSTLLTRINDSGAGVTASYDKTADRVVLVNNSTGDIGIGATQASSGLLDILGLGATSALVRGDDTKFTVNGGSELSSHSRTLGATDLGVTGLTVTANSVGDQTVTVKANTDAMKTAINSFITSFNAVQSYIDTQTKITKGADGKVTAALLADNREVQTWASELRSRAFSAVSGLSGTVSRLENLGIDFNSTDATLSIKDSAKMDAALTNNATSVAEFFTKDTTGFSAIFDDYLTDKLDTHGALQTQMDTLNKANTGIDAQIKTLNARLANQRELLTNAFIAMDNAKSLANQQQTTLDNMFNSTKSSSN